MESSAGTAFAPIDSVLGKPGKEAHKVSAATAIMPSAGDALVSQTA